METPAQTVTRLLQALEELSGTEHSLLGAGAYHDAHVIQERELPIVTKIAELLAQPNLLAQLSPETIARARQLIKAQTQQLDQLTRSMHETRAQIDAINAAEKRVKKLTPTYRQSSGDLPPSSSFAAQV